MEVVILLNIHLIDVPSKIEEVNLKILNINKGINESKTL